MEVVYIEKPKTTINQLFFFFTYAYPLPINFWLRLINLSKKNLKTATVWTVTLAKKFPHTEKYYIFTAAWSLSFLLYFLVFAVWWWKWNTHRIVLLQKGGAKIFHVSPRCMQAKDKGLFWKSIDLHIHAVFGKAMHD